MFARRRFAMARLAVRSYCPKETYLIFFSGQIASVIPICILACEKNQWNYPIHPGNTVNSPLKEFCPGVDPKNKVLYFSGTAVKNGKRAEDLYDIDWRERHRNQLKKAARFAW